MGLRVGLVVKTELEAAEKGRGFSNWLSQKGVEVIWKTPEAPGRMHSGSRGADAPADLCCVFVLGGDGTFLSAVRWIGDHEIPILGVKFGEVGFLAESTEASLIDVAAAILENRFETEARMRLAVTVSRNGIDRVQETVLNDLVVTKGALARLAGIRTDVDNRYLTTYRADGLIVSTPTGSTAYSLAAGGPVIHPSVPGVILTPICPFTLTNRPLVLPDSAVITLRLEERAEDMLLTFDGQTGLDVDAEDEIVIQKSNHPLHMVRIPGRDYFDVLKSKLRWSGGRG